MNQAIAANRAGHPRPLAAFRTPRRDHYRLRRDTRFDDMVNIQRTLMRACTAVHNSLYRASGDRTDGKVRGVPVFLINV